MGELIENGRLVDAILVFTLLEWGALALFHSRTGRGVAPIQAATYLASGAFLLGALRVALAGAWWGWIAACLLGALLAHLADLRRRWIA